MQTDHCTPEANNVVLVIDDEPMVLAVAEAALSRNGFRAVTAASGPEGIAVLRESGSQIAAAILDLTMPGMSGEQTFAELRAINSSLPIVLSSGYDQTDALSRIDKLHKTAFLQKPYQSKQLIQRLRTVLEG